MHPIQRVSLPERVTAHLREGIRRGRWGDVFPGLPGSGGWKKKRLTIVDFGFWIFDWEEAGQVVDPSSPRLHRDKFLIFDWEEEEGGAGQARCRENGVNSG